MKTKRFALLIGTIFLMGNIVLPAIVAAEEIQEGKLEITDGTTDIYYNGHLSRMIGFDMVDSEGATLVSSASAQEAFSKHSTTQFVEQVWGAGVNLNSFIGVVDLSNTTNAWELQAQVEDTFIGADGNEIALTDDNFKMITAADVWGDNVTLTNSQDEDIEFTAIEPAVSDETERVYAYTDPGSAYVIAVGDVVANLNVVTEHEEGILNNSFTYTEGIVDTPVTILAKVNETDPTPGIFGVSAHFFHRVPASTPADKYTTDVTYTLSTP